VLSRGGVGQQAERRGSVRVMAGCAVLEEDWRDIAGEGDCRFRRSGDCGEGRSGRNGEDDPAAERPSGHLVIWSCE